MLRITGFEAILITRVKTQLFDYGGVVDLKKLQEGPKYGPEVDTINKIEKPEKPSCLLSNYINHIPLLLEKECF